MPPSRARGMIGQVQKQSSPTQLVSTATRPNQRNRLLAAGAYAYGALYLVTAWQQLATGTIHLSGPEAWDLLGRMLAVAGYFVAGAIGLVVVGRGFLSFGAVSPLAIRRGARAAAIGLLLVVASTLITLGRALAATGVPHTAVAEYAVHSAGLLASAAVALFVARAYAPPMLGESPSRRSRDRNLLGASLVFFVTGGCLLAPHFFSGWRAAFELGRPTALRIEQVGDLVYVILRVVAPIVGAVGLGVGLANEPGSEPMHVARRNRYLASAAAILALAFTFAVLAGGASLDPNALGSGALESGGLAVPIGFAFGVVAGVMLVLAFRRPSQGVER